MLIIARSNSWARQFKVVAGHLFPSIEENLAKMRLSVAPTRKNGLPYGQMTRKNLAGSKKRNWRPIADPKQKKVRLQFLWNYILLYGENKAGISQEAEES